MGALGLALVGGALADGLPSGGLSGPTEVPVAPTTLAEVAPEATAPPAEDAAPPNFLFAQPAAMSALGDGLGQFAEPGTPSDFAVALGDFFTEGGGLAAGGAVEVGARAFGLTSRVTAARYRESWALRTLSHSYLSLASTRREAAVPDDPDDVLIALGLRATLLHGGDVLMQRAYLDAVDAVELDCTRLSREAELAGRLDFDPIACRQERYARAAADLPDPAWNAGGLVLSGAWTAGWLGGRYSGFQSEAVSAWLTGVAPLGAWGQAGLGLGWTQSFTEAPHTLAPTARFRAGVKQARVQTELGARLTPGDGALDPRVRVVLGGEARVQGSSWVHAQFGVEVDPEADLVTLLSGLDFRWGQADDPSFKPVDAP